MIRNVRRVATAIFASSLLVAAASVVAASNDEPTTASPMAAKWVPRKVHFMYSAVAPSSETTYYSCDKLEGQITTILRQLGAQDEVVNTFGCMTNGGPEKFPEINATFSVLEPVANGDQGATSSKNVDAQWDKVTLTRDASCDLIRQVKQHILPLFTTRNQTSGCSPHFSVEVLRAAKPAKSS